MTNCEKSFNMRYTCIAYYISLPSIGNIKNSLFMRNTFLKITSSYVLFFSNVTEVMVKVHVVDLKAESVAAPVTVRAYLNQTVIEFKQLISKVSFKIN